MKNENEVKTTEEKTTKKENINPEAKVRQIVIETDGNSVKVVKAEVAGNLELSAVLVAILNNIK